MKRRSLLAMGAGLAGAAIPSLRGLWHGRDPLLDERRGNSRDEPIRSAGSHPSTISEKAYLANAREVQRLLDQARRRRRSTVVIPEQFLPYDASSVSFPSRVRPLIRDQSRRVYDVRAYGAAGDGETDDQTACQKALDAGAGRIVLFPGEDAVYSVSTLLISSHTDVRIGGGAAISQIPSSGSNLRLLTNRRPQGDRGIRISGGRLEGNRNHQVDATNDLVRLTNCTECSIEDITLSGASRHGIVLRSCSRCSVRENRIGRYGEDKLGFGILLIEGCEDCRIIDNDCAPDEANVGIAVDSGTWTTNPHLPCRRVWIERNRVDGGGEGILIESSDKCRVNGNLIESVSRFGVRVGRASAQSQVDATRNDIVENTISDAGRAAVMVTSGADVRILDNSMVVPDSTGIIITNSEGAVSDVEVQGNAVKADRGMSIQLQGSEPISGGRVANNSFYNFTGSPLALRGEDASSSLRSLVVTGNTMFSRSRSEAVLVAGGREAINSGRLQVVENVVLEH